MEQYVNKLKRRQIILSIAVIIMTFINTNYRFGWIEFPEIRNEITDICQGIFTGITLLFCFVIIRYHSYRKDPKKLAILYNGENDERKKLIKQKSGMPMLLITSSIMLLCGIIAGFFNIVVFYTLIAAGMIQLTICAILKLIFIKIYS